MASGPLLGCDGGTLLMDRQRFCSAQAAAIAAFVCLQAHAAEPPRSSEVERLIREADAAVQDLDIDRARELWAQVYALEPSTMALCQLGQLDRRLGRLEEAAAELTRCVEQMRAPTNAVERRRYEVRRADLAAVRQRVAEVRLLAPPGTTQVLLDGKEVKPGIPIYVAPGQHQIAVLGQRGQVGHRLAKVDAGESRDVLLSFDHEPGASASTASETTPVAPVPAQLDPTAARARPVPWIVAAGAAASVALLFAGAGFHLSANGADDEVAAKTAKMREEQLLPSSPQFERLYDEATAANERANLFHGVGTGVLIAGVLAGAATVVYVALPRSTEIRASMAGAEVKIAW